VKLLAVDYGSKRIGLAISQGSLALPLTTLERAGGRGKGRDRSSGKGDADRSAIAAIAVLARAEGVTELVVGEPRRLDGTVGDAALRARAFAEALAQATRLPCTMADEALSSRAAEERLREAGVDPRRHPERVDQVAAQILLEQVLRQRARAALAGEPTPSATTPDDPESR
jgi:putative Holliday junction resolvase